ncbi:MAG: 2,3-bisphosphoglycerate-independent phosphoglycerate mutase [Gammaproteobacteria bacterium]|nr:2,3-bisphosphoglycerate-independent phosphoglycerate mutase [Gammaproteobacteria bacterium]
MQKSKPFVLIVLDGFGYSDNKEFNAIAAAHKPMWDSLWQDYAHTLISGSGCDVGLPDKQMGNSEVGHVNLGSGRVVYQDLTRLDKEIAEGEFFKNPVLTQAVDSTVASGKTLHIMGLLSPGGVHSQELHIQAMVKLAAGRGATKVMVHAFLDGRDTPPKSAQQSLLDMEALLSSLQVGRVASIVGRYYAMDRDQRWDRVELAYALLTKGQADYHALTAVQGLDMAYARGENDEFVKPTRIGATTESPGTIEDGDALIFMNYRSDRARQLSHAFVDDSFTAFARPDRITLAEFVTLTEYEAGLPATIAYGPQSLKNTLGEYLSDLGLTQLRIAETEKYAHVTFFFNGGVEAAYPGENRVLIPSPKVATYDLQPEMSAHLLTDNLVEAIASQKYDVIVCNYANADMVGHTGNFAATVKAIETLDECLKRVVEALQAVGGEALITADHGNAEKMRDVHTGQAHTAHTSEPVPLIYVGRAAKVLVQDGSLSDVAPTLLHLMGLKIPAEMTGKVIFTPQ